MPAFKIRQNRLGGETTARLFGLGNALSPFRFQQSQGGGSGGGRTIAVKVAG